MPASLTSTAAAPSLNQLHPSLALRARLGSVSVAWGTAALLVDLGMLFLAVAATEFGARAGGPSPSTAATLAFLVLSLALYQSRGLYAPRLVPDRLEDAKTVVVQTTAAAMAVLAVLLVLNLNAPEQISAGGVIRLWGFAAVYVIAGRIALAWSQAQARRTGEAVSPTLIVGRSDVARLVARRLVDRRELGLLPVGYVAPGAEPSRVADTDLPIPVVGCTADLASLAAQFDVTQVIVTASGASGDEDLLPVIARCEELGISVAYVPAVHERIGKNLRVEHVGALPLITAFATDPKGWQFSLKYGLDRVVATFLVLLAAPLFLACAVAVYLSMGRPIFFRQPRVGVDGREFGMLKFRSMRGTPSSGGEADAAWLAAQLGGAEAAAAVVVENRRTPVGNFLRRTSLDELPQLLNVVLGDMSLVGPRPERTSYVSELEGSIRRYAERHRVKAGITGWAQVHGLRGQTSIADRAEWDNWYIENFSLWLDVKILFLTAFAVLRHARQGE
ncbi:MAG TPA: sugar transferase [Gaiellaceae bacterium]|nr:sugar transferase [Gaiellaceae bacterium]